MSSSSSEKPSTSQNSKKLNVNNEIIQNYLQHAKGRDIKRFMRLNSKSSSSGESETLIGVEDLSGKDDNLSSGISAPVEEDEKPSSSKTKSELRTPEKKVNDDYLQAPDSITKNAKKLEWDSLGDVGYNKSNSTGNLSSLERSVLKELLNESPSEPNISLHCTGEMKSLSSISLNQQMRRERWRQTLDNLGKKYSSLSITMDTPQFSDLPQSTPVLFGNTDKAVQTTYKRIDVKTKLVVKTDNLGIQTNSDQMTSKDKERSVPRVDHSAQANFDRMTSRGSENKIGKEDHAVQTTFSRTSLETSKDAIKKLESKSEETQTTMSSSQMGSIATPSSFEYYPGDNEKSSSIRRPVRRSILSENNSNTESNKSKRSSDSDKENKAGREPRRSKSEVELGIKLLCSLIDAKNLTGKQKKNLAKKIFDKIMKEQSGDSTSTSQTSRSSAASAQSLIEGLHQEESNLHASSTMIEDGIPSVLKISEQTQTDLVKAPEHPPSSSSSHEEPVTMREWLHPLTRSEKDYDEKTKKKSSESPSAQSIERQKQLSWIESEINRLEGLKNLLQESSPRSRSTSSRSSGRSRTKPEVIYEETEDVINEEGEYQSSTRKSAQVVIYDEPHADVENVKYKTTKVTINQERRRASSTSSVRNHRSKLETPTSSSSLENESVSAFASHLQKEFMEKYSKKQRTTSEHYSEPRVYGKPVLTRNPSYTSVASSSFCVSSEMSIPIVESSSTTTTTHQYDSNTGNSVEGVAVQTSYSIVKTQPIFGPRCKCICTCGKQCRCSCPRPTLRVSGAAYHQTVQVKPQALAYVIRFTGTTDKEGKRLTKDCCTLQERLEAQYPDFCEKANKRQEILKKLHELRQERENRIREIAESSNMSSIAGKLEQLPPPPIKQARVFPTKVAKSMTRKRYSKLPEVVAKQEREKLERKKRANRIITGVFNKKLQKMVHDGKLSLEYSRTVI